MRETPLRQVVYLHGFASSAQSSKAQFFGERFASIGVALHTPDFNTPDFETLTVTRMIGQVDALVQALPPGPVALMGSSLGAFVAWHAAPRLAADAERHPVSHLVLLAPAVTFGRDRQADFGAGIVDAWERAGTREIFHYGFNEPRHLRYEFYRDAVAYQADDVAVTTPTLVFQGRHDDIVAPDGVAAFFGSQPAATVQMLDDGHQLLQHLDVMWEQTRRFLGV